MFSSTFEITLHTDHVGKGSIFYACSGEKYNEFHFIPLALEKGASTIVISINSIIPEYIIELIEKYNATIHYTEESPRKKIGYDLKKKYQNLFKLLKIIAITGTKGKTTTTFFCAHLLKKLGYKVAYLSTIQNSIQDLIFSTTHTTREIDYIYAFLENCIKNSIDYVVMEVSAQALTKNRIYGIPFDGIIFTNFSSEHMEFYKSLEDYFFAKKLILDYRRSTNVPLIYSKDDIKVSTYIENYIDEKNRVSVGKSNQSNYVINSMDNKFDFLEGSICSPEGLSYKINIKTICGNYNLYNIGFVLALINQLENKKIDLKLMEKINSTFEEVPGRTQRIVLKNGVRVCIDYAHSEESFSVVLSALRDMTKDLIVVFGCGGDRDKTKRPKMGRIAKKYSNSLYITSDNSRTEDPISIINDICSGIEEIDNFVKIIINREQAIKESILSAKKDSIVAILGKGHERSQLTISGEKKISDIDIVKIIENEINSFTEIKFNLT